MASSIGVLQWHPAELDAQLEVIRPRRQDTSTVEERSLTESKPDDSAALTRLRKQLAVQIEFRATAIDEMRIDNSKEEKKDAMDTSE